MRAREAAQVAEWQHLCEELARIGAEQANELRGVLKRNAVLLRGDSHLYDDLNDMTSELLNTQRELSRKNIELQRLNDELDTLARTDALTGAANRRRFIERAHEELLAAQRYRRPLSVLVLDVDSFKSINDTWGHAAGDEVLRHIARVCQQTLRETDVFGRLGGDEFAMLLVESNVEQAGRIAARVQNRLATQPAQFEGTQIPVTISVGMAMSPESDGDILEIMHRADIRMYASRQASGDGSQAPPVEPLGDH